MVTRLETCGAKVQQPEEKKHQVTMKSVKEEAKLLEKQHKELEARVEMY